MTITTVRSSETGKYYLSVPDADCRWGFYLTDGDSAWDGGFGLGNAEYVPTSRVVKRLEYAKQAIEGGYGYANPERYEFVNGY